MSLNWVLLPNSESDRRNGVTSSGSERSTPPSSSAQSRLNLEGLPEGWTMQVSNERMYRNFPIWILLSVWPDGLHYFRNICPFTAIKICPIVVFLPKWVHKFVIYNFFVIVANFCHMWSHWFPGGRTYRNKQEQVPNHLVQICQSVAFCYVIFSYLTMVDILFLLPFHVLTRGLTF